MSNIFLQKWKKKDPKHKGLYLGSFKQLSSKDFLWLKEECDFCFCILLRAWVWD